MSELLLDAERLLRHAEHATGVSDWGDDAFRTPLDLLVRSLREEANLNGRASGVLARRLADSLAQRLRLIEDRKRWPALAEVPVRRPIFVTGNGRSGTTLLHNLLSLMPGRRGLALWEMMRPSPPPEAAGYDSDPRIDAVESWLAAQGFKSASAMAKHPFGATRLEECSTILELALVGGYWGAVANIPTYTAYREQSDLRAAYRFHRMVLQHLSWRGPAGDLVLKAPEHMFHLPELLDVYPDAIVVVIHRDPARSIASLISIVAQMRGLFTDRLDLDAVVDSRFGYHRIMNRLRDIRAGIGRPGQFFDVQFADLDHDPLGTIEQLMDEIGLGVTDAYRDRIAAYMAAHPRTGLHRYALEDYGLSFADIDRAFAPYIRENGVRLER
jgi:hypothetical protein